MPQNHLFVKRWEEQVALSYSDNFDALVALTTHLGSTPSKSRRAPSLSRDLGFEVATVRSVLDGFPGIFRRSRQTDQSGEHYYTLHLRYARRGIDDEDDAQDTPNESLQPQELSTLLDLILKMVAHERDMANLATENRNQMSTLSLELKQKNHALIVTAFATLITSLLVSFVAAGVSLYVNLSKPNDNTKCSSCPPAASTPALTPK